VEWSGVGSIFSASNSVQQGNTVEDDMQVPTDRKESLLHSFVATDPTWKLDGIGAGDECRLLEDSPKVHQVYQSLPKESHIVIAYIPQRMAYGMCEFVDAADASQCTLSLIGW
jgi:hypothetical protein